jgi:hypothetical protein
VREWSYVSDIFLDEPELANAELEAFEEAGAALALLKQAGMTLMVIEQDRRAHLTSSGARRDGRSNQ